MGGTLSLLMTDIESSTRRWLDHEDAMARDLVHHDEVLAATVQGAGGRLVKHTGDGVLATFDDPRQAVAAAVEAQRIVAAARWSTPGGIRIRTAVHTGPVHQRDGDVFGPPVNRVARLLAQCPPGAVLVSDATAALLADHDIRPLTLRSVGTVSLRGFDRPETVYAIDSDHTATVTDLGASPLRGLPPIDDPIIGRVDERRAVNRGLDETWLVTLIGIGGMGKTRLALEVARDQGDGIRQVHWCDLSAVTAAEATAAVVLAAVGARQQPGSSAVESLCLHLGIGDHLVVLDNCEHVVDAVVELVPTVHERCPGTRFLCTSREALALRGERLVAVGSMPDDDAAELFLRRLAEVRPSVDDAAVDTEAIVRLCAQLDGIPLALELAAARCRSMTPAEVGARLNERFHLLRAGRSAVERHRTLHATIAWSYDLLDDTHRHVFESLALFANGSMLDGVAAVAGLDELDALDVLDDLVARSMVTAVDTRLGTRYRMLETLRQFGEERLQARGELADGRRRHLAWMVDWAEHTERQLGTPAGGDAFRRFVAELDNVRAAVLHALDDGQPERAERVVVPLSAFLVGSGLVEMIDWFGTPRAPRPGPSAELQVILAWMHLLSGDTATCLSLLDEVDTDSLDLRGRCLAVITRVIPTGDWHEAYRVLDGLMPVTPRDAIMCDQAWAIAAVYESNPGVDDERRVEIRRHAWGCIDRARATGDEASVATTLQLCAMVLWWPDDPLTGLEVASEARQLAEDLGIWVSVDSSQQSIAWCMAVLAEHSPAERRRAAATMARFIIEARARHNAFSQAMFVGAAAALLWPDDPTLAYVLDELRLRFTAATVGMLPPDAATAFSPAEREVLEEQARTITIDEAVRLTLDALERLGG